VLVQRFERGASVAEAFSRDDGDRDSRLPSAASAAVRAEALRPRLRRAHVPIAVVSSAGGFRAVGPPDCPWRKSGPATSCQNAPSSLRGWPFRVTSGATPVARYARESAETVSGSSGSFYGVIGGEGGECAFAFWITALRWPSRDSRQGPHSIFERAWAERGLPTG
jgi:hypothetical protein